VTHDPIARTTKPLNQVLQADIEWPASVNVPGGCNPPANTRYCSDGAVTRGQMAAFLHRLCKNVVDAVTIDGIDSADLVSVYGVAGAIQEDFLAPGHGSLLADTIEVPVDGFLHITAVVYAGDDATMANAGILVAQVDLDDDAVLPELLSRSDEGTLSQENCHVETITMSAVVPVTAGTHTLDVLALEAGYGTYIGTTSLSTIFTPFGRVAVG
jgi:hypothetical protein